MFIVSYLLNDSHLENNSFCCDKSFPSSCDGGYICPTKEERQALMDMAASIPELESSYGWNSSNAEDACTWTGINCSSDGTAVVTGM